MSSHSSVLLKEAIDELQIATDGVYIDATYGRGGHSKAILSKLGPKGKLIAIDKDPEAAEDASSIDDTRFHFFQSNFSDIPQILENIGLNKVNGILFDLGVSSPQLDNGQRGFSFLKNGPLDMRMNPSEGISLREWLLKADKNEIKIVLKEYGEERLASSIASEICLKRDICLLSNKEKMLSSTLELAKLIDDVYSRSRIRKKKGIHPATKSFQAFRIYLNNELDQLSEILEKLPLILVLGSRIVIISFHSLEDREVKQAFKALSQPPSLPRRLPVQDALVAVRGRLVGGPIRAGQIELDANPRARSATLRVIERVA